MSRKKFKGLTFTKINIYFSLSKQVKSRHLFSLKWQTWTLKVWLFQNWKSVECHNWSERDGYMLDQDVAMSWGVKIGWVAATQVGYAAVHMLAVGIHHINCESIFNAISRHLKLLILSLFRIVCNNSRISHIQPLSSIWCNGH